MWTTVRSDTTASAGKPTRPRRADTIPAGSTPRRSSRRRSLPHERVEFAHNSERQFAQLLDFYQIDWEYEPISFDIEWDRDGAASQRFTPDFYLPGFDLYIEITTLNQKLVTKKNRKARRLMALYPGVRCKILYQRDYLNLLVKYGFEEPSQKALLVTNGEGDGPEPELFGPALAG